MEEYKKGFQATNVRREEPFLIRKEEIRKRQNGHARRQLDISAIRARQKEGKGEEVWRALDELGETPEYLDFKNHEFPPGVAPWQSPVNRRDFLKLAGASLMLAGLAACRKRPIHEIVPYVKAPEEIVPGKPLYYASALTLGGYGIGVLVEAHEGRPTKIEGNPDHPASLGATDAYTQAMILDLYDPDRSKTVLNMGTARTLESFLQQAKQVLADSKGGEGVRILTETVTSPTLQFLMGKFLQRYPKARWYQYEPFNRDSEFVGTRLAFGEPVCAVYDLSQAEVILSLDADFLMEGPGRIRYTKELSRKRAIQAGKAQMPRLYVVESASTVTGWIADHRVAVRPSQVDAFARSLAHRLGVPGVEDGGWANSEERENLLEAIRDDMLGHRGRCVVIPGMCQTPEVHAIAQMINVHLGNAGTTVKFVSPPEGAQIQVDSLKELVNEMKAGGVKALFVLGGNPVLTAPGSLGFAEALSSVAFSVHLASYVDETSKGCHWHVPMAHELESWGDVRSYDGTVSIIQPLIEPLFGGKSSLEFLSALLGDTRGALEILKDYWRHRSVNGSSPSSQVGRGTSPSLDAGEFENVWRKWLHDGFIPNTALGARQVQLKGIALPPLKASGEIEVNFRPDPGAYDGRFANNAWLRELPQPFTKICWDNVGLLSPRTAERLGVVLEYGEGRGTYASVVEITVGGKSLSGVPVWVVPGHPDDVLTLTLGLGRSAGGQIAQGLGYNAYPLFPGLGGYLGGATIRKKNTHPIARTQLHFRMEGRDFTRSYNFSNWKEEVIHPVPGHQRSGEVHGSSSGGAHPSQGEHEKITLYPDKEYTSYAWAMVIDTNLCTGCNACVVACQAENNIPVVGKEQVRRGREMHWIRIDQYYVGNIDGPSEIRPLPVPCMHCERAPCEVVCPVAATVHSEEGLNEMVYNRCVGTRYCSNNCPYKVRRFNFFDYHTRPDINDWAVPLLHLLKNPDVTVRSRGVMEKCSYCVQRINEARKAAKKEDRRIRDLEVMTACQQVCPAGAIVFGDKNDPNSKVSQWRSQHQHYRLLEELNVEPRTTYLARFRNPNPRLAGRETALIDGNKET